MGYYSPSKQVLSPNRERFLNDASWIAVRLAVVLAFLLGMPLLALPRVQQAVGEAWAPDSPEPDPPIHDSHEVDLRTPVEPDQVVKRETAVSRPEVQLVGEDLSNEAAPPSEIEQRKQRLIELGVTYMVLEKVGVDGARYRFTCQLPVAAGSPYRRKLQAVDADPVQAMAEVQRQIEAGSAASGDGAQLPRPTVKLR